MAQKLLLADDSVTIQRVIELTFADENIQVVAVSDGDQAIARIDADPPDIVLADVGMPGRNGYEVAAHVKGTPHLAHIPVVLLTGAFEPVDQARAAEVGSDGVLAKPFEPQLVIARVKELLTGARAPSAAAPPLDVQLAPPPTAPAEGDGHLDDYFDRLDAAFATFTSQPAAPAPPAPPPNASTSPVPEIDWFGSVAPANPPDLPLSYASPPPVAPPVPESETTRPSSRAVSPAPLPIVPASAVPTLGDAFAALLAAEQADSAPVAWPASTPEIGDSVIEEVTRRVLDRMSDRVVRETVSSLVASVTERLVRDEIDRIKSTIK